MNVCTRMIVYKPLKENFGVFFADTIDKNFYQHK